MSSFGKSIRVCTESVVYLPAQSRFCETNKIMRLVGLYIILCLSCLSLASCDKKQPAEQAPQTAAPPAQETAAKADAGGALKPLHERPIKYTYKAFCQMRCNRYTTTLVKQAIKEGKIKTKNKWLERKPCPFYAVEFPMKDNNKLYLVIASCDDVTKVVRVFDTNRKQCDCDQKPGAKAKP